jgi:hypothetical protein
MKHQLAHLSLLQSRDHHVHNTPQNPNLEDRPNRLPVVLPIPEDEHQESEDGVPRGVDGYPLLLPAGGPRFV